MLEKGDGQRPEWRDISDRGPIYMSYWVQWKSLAVRDRVQNVIGNRQTEEEYGPNSHPPQQGDGRPGGDARRHIRRISWNLQTIDKVRQR